jgi:hypothetical protein
VFLSCSASLSGVRIDKNGRVPYLVLNPPSSLTSTQLATDPFVMSSDATASGTTPADPRCAFPERAKRQYRWFDPRSP